MNNISAILEGLNKSTPVNEGYDNLLKAYNDKFSKLDKNIVCTDVSSGSPNVYIFMILDKKSKTEFIYHSGACGYTSSIEANTSDKSRRFHYYLNSIDKDKEIVDYISRYRELSKRADKVAKSLDKMIKSFKDINSELNSMKDISEEDFNMIVNNNYKRQLFKKLKVFYSGLDSEGLLSKF